MKLIDFGAATWERDVHATIIQTRHYRSVSTFRPTTFAHAASDRRPRPPRAAIHLPPALLPPLLAAIRARLLVAAPRAHAAATARARARSAPEVVMGLDWTFPCDMWSIGCIVLELHEGRLTFDTHDTAQHLAMMERLSGAKPGAEGMPRAGTTG